MKKNEMKDLFENAVQREVEINQSLKEVEVFKFGQNEIILEVIISCPIIIAIYILMYKVLKDLYEVESITNIFSFLLSPLMFSTHFIIIILPLIAITIFLIRKRIKINLNEKYLKMKLFRKIKFEEIASIRVKKIGFTVGISVVTLKGKNREFNFRYMNSQKITIGFIKNLLKKDEEKLEKLFIILKKSFGEKFFIEEYQRKVTIKEIVKNIFISVLVIVFMEGLCSANFKFLDAHLRGEDIFKIFKTEIKVQNYKDGYSEIPYRNDKRNGVGKYYTLDKKLIGEITFKNDLKVLEKEYYDNGKLHKETKFKDEFNKEYYKVYYPNGNLEFEIIYNEDLVVEKKYTEDGKLYKEDNFRENIFDKLIPHGKRIVYYPNGQKFIELEYVEGKPLFPIKVYEPNGRLKIEEIYVEEEEKYIQFKHEENGEVKSSREFDKNTTPPGVTYYDKIRIFNYFLIDGVFEKEIEILNSL